jgi:rRNA-processing protein FCF1
MLQPAKKCSAERKRWARAGSRLKQSRRRLNDIAASADDDKILECAIAANADYIVTGNIRDFRKQLRGVSVFAPRGFLNVLALAPAKPFVSPVVGCGLAE